MTLLARRDMSDLYIADREKGSVRCAPTLFA